MRLNALLILSLLAIVIAAPVVDAIACDDCRDIISVRDMQRRSVAEADYSDNLPSFEADCPAPRKSGTARDLCPVCANIAVAMGNAYGGAPSMISQSHGLPKLIVLSDPSYSIAKPPQN